MVRIIKLEQHTETTVYIEGACLSTDTKPKKANGFNVITGSRMTEVDTGDVYAYDETGESWGKIAAGPAQG